MNRTVITSLLLLLGFATLHGQQTNAPSSILVNHVGFMPQAAKHCLIAGSTSVTYEVIDTATGQAAFTGTTPGGPDLGSYQVGDFSGLNRPGTFQVRAVTS